MHTFAKGAANFINFTKEGVNLKKNANFEANISV